MLFTYDYITLKLVIDIFIKCSVKLNSLSLKAFISEIIEIRVVDDNDMLTMIFENIEVMNALCFVYY
jgi:hypothetical protein